MRLAMRSAVIPLICSLFCMSAGAAGKNADPDTADFVFVRENNGIALYERWYSLNPTQQAREVKATFQIKTDPYAALALIRDEKRGTQWNRNTQAYKVLSDSEDSWFGYIQYDLPWPVSNQDCVLQYSKHYSGNTLLVEFKGTSHPSFPIHRKIQRIPEINGKWIFTESDEGIDVEYYISTTPSNTLPAWVTDPIIRNNLIETLSRFRNILESNP